MGYIRIDRMMNGMFSKSSKQFADRFEKKVLTLGLGIGATLLSGGGGNILQTTAQEMVATFSHRVSAPGGAYIL